MLKTTNGGWPTVLLSPDAPAGGSPEPADDVKRATSSTAEPTENEPSPEPVPEPEPGDEPTPEPSPEPEPAPGDEPEPSPEPSPEPEPEPVVPPVVDKEGDDTLPFNAHPRWKELVGEKNEYKQTIEQLKPAVEQARALNEFLAQNSIPPAEFQAALQYMQALRSDPAKAFAMIKPTYERLAGFTGERLDADLQTEVAAGTLLPERGAEIQRARAQQQWNQWRQQSVQQTQQSGSATIVRQAINGWQQLKTQSDMELKEGTPLWEQVNLRLNAMPPFQSAEQAWQGAEKAYNESKAFLGKFQAKPKPVQGRRPPQSQATSQTNRMVIKDANDVVKAMIANGGRAPSNIRYS